MRGFEDLTFQGLIEKLKIKLFPNYKLLNMDQESAKSSKTSIDYHINSGFHS